MTVAESGTPRRSNYDRLTDGPLKQSNRLQTAQRQQCDDYNFIRVRGRVIFMIDCDHSYDNLPHDLLNTLPHSECSQSYHDTQTRTTHNPGTHQSYLVYLIERTLESLDSSAIRGRLRRSLLPTASYYSFVRRALLFRPNYCTLQVASGLSLVPV